MSTASAPQTIVKESRSSQPLKLCAGPVVGLGSAGFRVLQKSRAHPARRATAPFPVPAPALPPGCAPVVTRPLKPPPITCCLCCGVLALGVKPEPCAHAPTLALQAAPRVKGEVAGLPARAWCVGVSVTETDSNSCSVFDPCNGGPRKRCRRCPECLANPGVSLHRTAGSWAFALSCRWEDKGSAGPSRTPRILPRGDACRHWWP